MNTHLKAASIYSQVLHAPFVWNGEILNTGFLESWEYEFYVYFDQRLTEAHRNFFEQCVGYAAKVSVRGESPEFEWRDNSCRVMLDTTKTARDDVGDIWEEFWQNVLEYMMEGSPKRVRKQNTRLFYRPEDFSAKVRFVQSDMEN